MLWVKSETTNTYINLKQATEIYITRSSGPEYRPVILARMSNQDEHRIYSSKEPGDEGMPETLERLEKIISRLNNGAGYIEDLN